MHGTRASAHGAYDDAVVIPFGNLVAVVDYYDDQPGPAPLELGSWTNLEYQLLQPGA